MESVEASRNGMPLIVSNKGPLSQAADPNSIVLRMYSYLYDRSIHLLKYNCKYIYSC
jgi:hypothetical protein